MSRAALQSTGLPERIQESTIVVSDWLSVSTFKPGGRVESKGAGAWSLSF